MIEFISHGIERWGFDSSWHFSAVPTALSNVGFSNRPFRVKRFQTIHHYSVDVAHGLVLLFGIGTKGPSIMGFEDEAEQSIGRPCRLVGPTNDIKIYVRYFFSSRAMANPPHA